MYWFGKLVYDEILKVEKRKIEVVKSCLRDRDVLVNGVRDIFLVWILLWLYRWILLYLY